MSEPRCPVCGATEEGHEIGQRIANEIRAAMGLPPLAPPDIRTGHQLRPSSHKEGSRDG